MSYGFIYYLANPSMPGLIKVGMTSRHPRERMEELTRATACPEPFQMLAYFDTPDPTLAEREIHHRLARYRVNDSREFFKAPYGVLQIIAREWIDTAEGCSYTAPLDKLAHNEWARGFATWMMETL